jgi:hypothetical protein
MEGVPFDQRSKSANKAAPKTLMASASASGYSGVIAAPTITPSSAPLAPIPTSNTTPGTLPTPDDRIESAGAVHGMRVALEEVLRHKDTITFLVTEPGADSKYIVFLDALLSDACRISPRQCYFTQVGDGHDLDKPIILGSTRTGTTVHGADANILAIALGNWFVTYSTSSIPSNLAGYRWPESKELIWIDIGPGSPWKDPAK